MSSSGTFPLIYIYEVTISDQEPQVQVPLAAAKLFFSFIPPPPSGRLALGAGRGEMKYRCIGVTERWGLVQQQ